MSENDGKAIRDSQVSNGDVSSRATVVGIGASAGGLVALKRLFELFPADCGLVFVVVVHLSPEHKSHLADLLQPNTKFPVRQVTETTSLEANNVYVIPPNANLSAIDTHLRLSKLEESRRERAPIDRFFRTLASTHDGHSIGVILTGTGSDGTLGLREIKAKGGVILVQDPNQAEFDGMPQSAIATGLVDRILPLEEIPEALMRLAAMEPKLKRASASDDPTAAERALLPKIVAILKARTERDFSRYKPATLLRRIARRMQLSYLDDFEAYLNRLREQPDEARALADDLLINVTSFFRDPEVFQKLQKDALPHLFEGKESADTLRVWSVGCATGEEAYSLAMVLLEEAARHEAPPKLQIFASDLHKRSLDSAREGLFPGDIQTDVSPERLKRFFQRENGGYRICKEVRDLVVFAPHNLLSDPPFSRLDLITCRNLLIYLERGVQRDVIDLFHYALCPNGYLLLGSAETIDAAELFRTEDKKLCIYRKRNVPAPEPRLPVFPLTRFRVGTEPSHGADYPALNVPSQSLHQQLLERFAPPSILIGPDNRLVHSSERAGRYLMIPGGETTFSALRLVREELRIELSALLQAARDAKSLLDSRPISVRFNGHSAPVVMHVRPAQDADQEGFVLVIFEEHQAQAAESQALQVSDGEGESYLAERVRALEAELTTARQRLQATIEEYETSREEMKASHEEMQSTNEELRSTMEELETSKEELQSINEELQTVNQENRHKVEELSQLSSDLQNLLTSTDIATLFLDRDFRILRFTPRLADLFNVRITDRGRPISDLTHRLGYEQLREDARIVLERLVPIEREIQDEAGRWYLTRVLPYRSTEDRIEGIVITFVEITARKKIEEALRESEVLRTVALSGGGMGTWRWNLKQRLVWGDAQFLSLWGLEPTSEPVSLSSFTERMSPAGAAEMEAIVTRTVKQNEEFDGPLEIMSGPTAGRWIRWRGRADALDESVLYGVTFDITMQKQVETLMRESEERQTFLLKLSDALRPLSDPIASQEAAMLILGSHLGVHRAFYGEMLDDDDTFVVGHGYTHELFPIQGEFKFSDFDTDLLDRYRVGQTVVINDLYAEMQLSDKAKTSFDSIQVRAAIAVPLVKDRRVQAIVSLHHAAPRQWTNAEVAIVQETAERTWAAVERAKAEKALRESEELYRNLFNSIDEGVTKFEVLFDEQGRAVDWIILENNPALTRMTGLPPTILGKRASEVYSDLEPYWLETFGRVAKTGEPIRGENFVRELNRWFDFFASRIGGEGSNTLVGVYNDITNRRRTEAALRENQERQAFLLKLSDLLRPFADAVEVQSETTRLLGEHLGMDRCYFFETDQQAGEYIIYRDFRRSDLRSLAGRHRIEQWPEMTAALRRGETLVVNNYADSLDIPPAERPPTANLDIGGIIIVPLVKQGSLIACLSAIQTVPREWKDEEVSLVRDVAERTWAAVERARAETALRAVEENQRALLEGMPQLVWRSKENGFWTWTSPQWKQFTGQSIEESRGHGWLKVLHPDDVQPALDAWKDAAQRGAMEVDYRIKKQSSGEYRYHQTRSIPIFDESGRTAEWLGTCTDIEEMKRAEAARQVVEERAAALTRSALAEKEELLKEVHHRVKNNLQVITSLLNLQADKIADHQALVAFDEARNRVAAIASIHELLYRSTSFSAVHLADYARAFAPTLVDFYGAQGRVAVEIVGDGVTLELERAVPYGLLLNELLSNALKHAFEGGRSGHLTIRFEQEAGTGFVTVVDDGVGIPSDFVLERASSLGLKLVRNLAGQLRGTIQFENAEPGTRVTVQFPLSRCSDFTSSSREEKGAEPARSARTAITWTSPAAFSSWKTSPLW